MYNVFTCTFGEVCTFREMQKASIPKWIKREFGAVKFGDRRLEKRVAEIASDLSRNPQSSIPKASGEWARTKGAYRFFDHSLVAAEEILASHRQATIERMARQETILMVQDTTGLNYVCQDENSGLGSVGNRDDAALGMWLHTTLCLDGEGVALGIADAQMWVRDPAKAGIAAQRKRRPIEDKESHRWLKSFAQSVCVAEDLPNARVVNIADREGDIYELFAQAASNPNVGVLVRARHDRRLEKEQQRLWQFIENQTPAGEVEITLPRKPGIASHKARFELRFGEVELKCREGQHKGLKLWIIEARQIGVSSAKALCWKLVTNLPVTNLASAMEKVQWYRLRWRIEEFHRVLKSGCKAESRQLEQLHRLKNVLAIDMIIAWRVLELTRASRQRPDAPATELLSEGEVLVICAMAKKFSSRNSLTLKEAVGQIAQWGGFLGRKSDGDPGPMTIWSGLLRLDAYYAGFNQAQKLMGNG